MIYREPTSKRRAQRVKIPVFLEINGKIYQSEDISVLGIGIKTTDDLPIEINDQIKGKLILPFKDAYLTIPVNLICRHKSKNKIGFEFKDLDDHTRQVIRHYIELAIEGRLEDLEDIISSLAIKELESPIVEGLDLAEEEQLETYRRFKRHFWFWIVFGTIIIGAFLYYVIYNVIFTYKTWGIITWDTQKAISHQDGIVKKINVKPGQNIKAGDVIAELKDPEIEKQEQLTQEILNKLKTKEIEKRQKQREIASLLERLLNINYKEYQEAKRLYKARKISLKDFKYIEKNYLRLALLAKEKENIFINKPIIDLEEKLATIQAQKEKLLIRAPTNGKIEEVFIEPNSYIIKGQEIASIKTSQPYIIAKIPNWKLTEIDYKEKIIIFDPFSDKKVAGKILAIGLTDDTEIDSLNQKSTFIKIGISEETGSIPKNARVKIWFTNKIYTKFKKLFSKFVS